jgi:hypothetical protein
MRDRRAMREMFKHVHTTAAWYRMRWRSPEWEQKATALLKELDELEAGLNALIALGPDKEYDPDLVTPIQFIRRCRQEPGGDLHVPCGTIGGEA